MKKISLPILAFALLSANAYGNKPPKKQKGAAPAAPTEAAAAAAEKPKDKTATIESKTKNAKRIDGLFPFSSTPPMANSTYKSMPHNSIPNSSTSPTQKMA
jgi:hypothetical protein